MMALLRIFSYGIQGFRRNIWLSVIAIITMTMTISTITIFALVNVAANARYQELNGRINYVVFLKDEASEAGISQLRSQIENQPQVQAVTYTTKEEAKAEFERDFESVDLLKGAVTSENNPLPRQLKVTFTDPTYIDAFHTFTTQERYSAIVERSSYSQQDNKERITRFIRFTNFMKVFGLSFTLVFIVIALLVIFNTIRLAIFSRREEIEIMRLVGATRGFIRGPFILEGVLFGFMGALISAVIIWTLLMQLKEFLVASFSLQESNFVTDLFGTALNGVASNEGVNALFLQASLAQICIGVLLGTLCSYWAVRRYLKE
jgi:cell division transport system permease protein